MKKTSFRQSGRKRCLAAAASSLIAFSLTAGAQLIYNGEQMLSFMDDKFEEPMYFGFGEDGDAEITLDFSDITSGPGMRMADSDGTGSFNEVILNIPPYSRLTSTSGAASYLGVDGKLTINVIGDEWEGGEGGSFRPKSTILSDQPGSEVEINVDGHGASWTSQHYRSDWGARGTTTVNIKNGGQFIGLSRVIVGGGLARDDENDPFGTAYFNVDGEGTRVASGTTSKQYLSVGHRGTGYMTVSNGAHVDTTTGNIKDPDDADAPHSAYEIWVGRQTGGIGTLTIESGGRIDTREPFRINSQGSIRGEVLITGEDSVLNVQEPAAMSYIGNTADQVGEEPPIGILRIEDGGLAHFEKHFRVGNQKGAHGEIYVDGPGSLLKTDHYFQLGHNGFGKLAITNGGRVEVNQTDGFYTSAARSETGTAEIIIDGEDSLFSVSRMLIGSNASLEPYGPDSRATIQVTDGAEFHAAGLISIGNGSVLTLDNGKIIMHRDVVPSRPNIVQIGNPDTIITGNGLIDSDVRTTDGAKIIGTGDGIEIEGTIYEGHFENVLAKDIEIAPTTLEGEERKASGPVTLNGVRFKPESIVTITINDESFAPLLTFDGDTDFSEAGLMIEFSPFEPDTDWYARIFRSTGDSNHEPNFGWDALPGEWIITNGILHHESISPPEDESPYLEWADQFGLSGADADPNANPAGDGFSNLEKFAFGIDPNQAVASLAQLSKDGNNLTLRWNQSTNPEITYTVQTKSDLDEEEWTDISDASPTVMNDPDVTPPAGYERVEWSTEIPDEDRGFYRVISDVDPNLLP